MHTDPARNTPNPQRAALAVAVAPVLVLMAFTLVIAGIVEAAAAFAVFVACTCWLVYELHRYQRQLDDQAEGQLDKRAGTLLPGSPLR